MDVLLTRLHRLSTGIFSSFVVGNDKTFFVAEHAYPTSLDTFEAKIIPGVYTCIRRHSPEFGYALFWVTDVPGCTWIEIHVGNFPQKDSEGCVLMGTSISINTSVPMVGNSNIAFREFMVLQMGVDQFKLTVI